MSQYTVMPDVVNHYQPFDHLSVTTYRPSRRLFEGADRIEL